MALVPFKSVDGEQVFVNPLNVAYVREIYTVKGETAIIFNSSSTILLVECEPEYTAQLISRNLKEENQSVKIKFLSYQ
jgi:hypothetical protein